jgi:hypothetical protein
MGHLSKVTLATIMGCFFAGGAFAQDEAGTDAGSDSTGTSRFTVGAIVGTAGLGLQANIGLSGSWGIRAGFQFLPGAKINQDDRIGKVDVEHKYKINTFNIHALADYYTPFLSKLGFRFTGGLSAFLTAKADVTSVPVGEYYHGEIPLYLGTGFARLIKAGNLSISADLGTYYLFSKPDVEMTATGYLKGNERNQEQLKTNLKGYRWLPNVQIGIHYAL